MKKIVSIVSAIVLVFGMTFSLTACGQAYQKSNGINNVAETENAVFAVGENGMAIQDGQVMPSSMTVLTSADVSAKSSGITLSAMVTPNNASNQNIDWSVSWKDSNEDNAFYTVTSYLIVTPASDGAKTAYVQCLKPFKWQILITASSRAYPDVKATCTVDYQYRLVLDSLTIQSTANNDTAPERMIFTEYSGRAFSLPYYNKLGEVLDHKIVNVAFSFTDGTVSPDGTAGYPYVDPSKWAYCISDSTPELVGYTGVVGGLTGGFNPEDTSFTYLNFSGFFENNSGLLDCLKNYSGYGYIHLDIMHRDFPEFVKTLIFYFDFTVPVNSVSLSSTSETV